MGTAGGEPRVLLNALKPMLGVVGDIKTPQEVMRVVGMMKDAEKLMSRCVYLNILKATCRQAMQNEEKKETLQKFLATGGWGILNKWLFEFTKSENFPVLLELIEVLKVLPITVDLLKQGNTGKLIKQMTKLEHSDVKKNSAGLIKQWKDMIMKKKPGYDNENKNDENQENSTKEKGALEKRKKNHSDSTLSNRDSDEKLKRKIRDSAGKQVADSSGFINALAAAASVPVKKKRRTSNDSMRKTTLPLDEILKNSNESKETKPEADGDRVETAGSPEPEEEEKMSYGFRSPAVEAANQALAEDSSNGVIIDEGSLARKRNKKKRNITWAPDDQLVQISYFELMEGEKKGHHNENFSQARQLELMFEKQALRGARRSEDRMVEKMQWCRLIPVDNAGVPNFMAGEKSREKFIQGEREKTVLAYIFLTKQSLPDNPSEPEFDPQEHNNRSQPRMIPHDEDGTILPPSKTIKPSHAYSINSNSSTQGSSQPPVQTTKSEQNKQPNHSDPVSPAVQNIMSQLLRNNVPNEPQKQLQPPQQPNQPPQLINNSSVPTNIPNMGPSILGQPAMVPPIMPPFPGNQIPPMNQPGQNNMNPNNFIPPVDPSVRMENPNPSLRGRGGINTGPRFPGGQFNHNGRGGGEAGFNLPGGPVVRPRWDGPPNQGPPPNRNGNWNQNDGQFENFHNENFSDNFNENYNEDFHSAPKDNNFGSDGFGGRGRGFRRGVNNNRGRGISDRGRGSNDRGRGSNDRGRGSNDRGRFHNNKDWNARGNDGGRSRGNDWNRDERNNMHTPNRGRDRHVVSEGLRNRDDRINKVPCQHFLTPRGCSFGDRCKFSHVRR